MGFPIFNRFEDYLIDKGASLSGTLWLQAGEDIDEAEGYDDDGAGGEGGWGGGWDNDDIFSFDDDSAPYLVPLPPSSF